MSDRDEAECGECGSPRRRRANLQVARPGLIRPMERGEELGSEANTKVSPIAVTNTAVPQDGEGSRLPLRRNNMSTDSAGKSTPMLPPIWRNIPKDMQVHDRWVVWRQEGGKKVPYSGITGRPVDITKVERGVPLKVAQAAYNAGQFDGVGFILAGDGIVAADLDDCVVDGVPSLAASKVMNLLGAQYIELSPSGTGLHGFGLSSEAFAGRSLTIDGVSVELYSHGRYMTVTGCTQDPDHGGGASLQPMIGYTAFGPSIRTQSGVVERSTATQVTEVTQATQATQATHSTQAAHASGPPAIAEEHATLTFPANCLPQKQGMRNGAIFRVARFLKGRMPNASEDHLYRAFSYWHGLVVDAIATKDLGISWAEFMVAWGNVTTPHGDVLKKILGSGLPDLPDWMRRQRFGPTGEKLLQICLALAEHHDPEPFFLPARTAGELLDCHFTTAATLLKAMNASGYLRLVALGHSGVASTYWIGSAVTDAARTRK